MRAVSSAALLLRCTSRIREGAPSGKHPAATGLVRGRTVATRRMTSTARVTGKRKGHARTIRARWDRAAQPSSFSVQPRGPAFGSRASSVAAG